MFRDLFHPPVSFAYTSPDINLAGSKIANKPVSFRKLCARPDLKVSRSTLMNMVRVAAQRQFLIDGGIIEEAVGYSQLVVLTRLENNEEKLALAQECIDEQLSERKLKLRVQEIREQSLISSKLIQLVAVLTETPASPETEPPVSPPVSTDA